ncbi:helix-turn-helix domain-containing protein [Burkholderia orbicola]|uniref:helix-turn-helix domain-containing protein n=1 Tax=Burkholderia orbicola TaxID=2978683 RepID=UPI00264C4355|nr:helix-turn-helix domain-containing protein [Burkholderia orbicola]MDN7558194.1 helix-turn-helix domain-containing protein [Burkholderia orbicola]
MAKFTPSPLGTRIHQARKALGLSQMDLAQEAQISQSTISGLESGRRQDTGSSELFAIASALHESAYWLVTGERTITAAADKNIDKPTNEMDINRAAGEISLAVAALQSIHALTRNQQISNGIDPEDFYVAVVDLVVRTGMRLEVAHNAIGEGLIGQFEYPIKGCFVPREVVYG